MASKPLNQAVIAPSTPPLPCPLDGCTREQFLNDLVDECEKDIRGRLAADAVRMSTDFTEHGREEANGVAQIACIGVVDPQSPRVERTEEVSAGPLLASRHIPKERLGSTDDCGFPPFSIDVKPGYGSPGAARDIAFQKTRARVEGTAMASQRIGMA